MRERILSFTISALAFLFLATPAHAYIMAEISMKQVLTQTQFIFTARVESFDAEKRTAVFSVDEHLKGKVPFQKLHMALAADKDTAREYNKPSYLLKRLAAKQTVVFFVDAKEGAFAPIRRGNLILFLYANGTWVQFAAVTEEKQTSLPIAFHHFEPYLRRTFKGTSDEMRQVIVDGLAGKKAPPPYDAKEPGGFGPELGKDKAKDFPKGSEKAVAAVREAVPTAEIDEVTEPKGFFGSGGKGTPLFWTVRFHAGATKREVSVTPEGVIIRLPIQVDIKSLPKSVADAVAKVAPGETVKIAEKNEMRATLKYVALDKPRVQKYAVDVGKEGKTTRFIVSPDGKSATATAITPDKKADKPAKEFDVPAKAAKAVAALKALYPDLAVLKITHEVFDGGTGDLDILTYEVEFVTKGIEREMVASPEGVIPHLWAPVEAKDVPKAVSDALDKAAPGAKIEKARSFEIRASLRFGALEEAKVYYTVHVEKDGKTRTLSIKPNGDLIKRFEFPKKK